jgi:hypothetical protein
LQPTVAAQGFLHCVPGAGKLGRVKHYQAKSLASLGQSREVSKNVPPLIGNVGNLVQLGIGSGQIQSLLRNIDAQDVASAGPGRMKAEPACVAKGIQNAPTRGQGGDRLAIAALVEVKTGFLTFLQVDQKAHPVFFNDNGLGGHAAPKWSVLQFQAFELANASLGAEINAFRLDQLHEHLGQQIAPDPHTQPGKLDHQPEVIAVHRKTGQPVRLAKNKPAGLARPIQSQDGTAQMQGGSQPVPEKSPVEGRIRRPGIQADPDLATAIIKTASHKVAGVRNEVNLGAILRFAYHFGNGPGKNPGMMSIKRPGSPGMQDDARHSHGLV